jgi:tRNA-specific 2-thiouridylase
MLTEDQLRRTLFPLGELTKEQVREIARQHGYESLAQKRESQEICFIPDDDYRAFLRANVPDYKERVRAGEYVDAEGRVLGMHEGFVNYTIGQRKGLGIALGHPAYVTHIDAKTNRVTLGTNDDLLATEVRFRATRISSIPRNPRFPSSSLTAKVRYRSQAVPVKTIDEGRLEFASPVWGITPGQSVVIYQDDLVVGGGIIIS